MPFAELHCHSHFSFLDGAASPHELVERAVALGMPALAVTDHDGLYGAVRFSVAAQEAGIRPIVGLKVTRRRARRSRPRYTRAGPSLSRRRSTLGGKRAEARRSILSRAGRARFGAAMTDPEEPIAVTFQAADGVRIEPADWEARAAALRAGLMAEEVAADDLGTVLGTLRLVDGSGRWWVYDGTAWRAWDGRAWVTGVPAGPLTLQAFTLEFEADAEAAPQPAILETPEPALQERPTPLLDEPPTSTPPPTR